MTKKVKVIPNSEWITYLDNEKVSPIISVEMWNLANERLKRGVRSLVNLMIR